MYDWQVRPYLSSGFSAWDPNYFCFIMLIIVLHGLQGSANIVSTFLSLFLQSEVVNAC